jgi:DHA1 family inner membrane transport protein
MSAAPQGTPDASDRFPWAAMVTLATAAFLCVTSESLPTGLLPEIGAGLGVSTPEAGVLVSVYAFTLVIAATPLTALTRRIPRRPLLVGSLVIVGIGSVLMAIAPSYGFSVVARVIGGASQGVFWAVMGGYTGTVLKAPQLSRGIAITSGGVSLALILGAPLATILGHAAGWRVAFASVGVLLMVGGPAIYRLLPVVPSSAASPATAVLRTITGGIKLPVGGPDARASRAARIRPVIVICALIGLITLGNFTLNAYVAPYIADAMGLGTAAVGPLLVIGGLMGAVAVVLVGSVMGKRPLLWIVLCLSLTTVSVALLGLFAGMTPLALAAFALWALAFGGLPPLIQTEMLQVSPLSFRDTASALWATAFNVGIGGGALLGGAVYAGWGLGAVPWVAFALLAVSIVMLAVMMQRHVFLGAAGRSY